MKTIAALPVLIAFLVGALPAHAWTWPVSGPVLQSFVFGDDPFAAGQHRGIDIGGHGGAAVAAPAAGTVVFAGTLPRNGRTVTVVTREGYAVTLLHLGSISVSRGAMLAEGDPIGTLGSSGKPEHATAYVHLGVRIAADEHGYVDPLSLLPPLPAQGVPAEAPEPPPTEPVPGAAEERPDEASPLTDPAHPAPGGRPAEAPADTEPEGAGTGGQGPPAEHGAGAPDRAPEPRSIPTPSITTPARLGLAARSAVSRALDGGATEPTAAGGERHATGARHTAGREERSNRPASQAAVRRARPETTTFAARTGRQDEQLGRRVGTGVAAAAAGTLALFLAGALLGTRRLRLVRRPGENAQCAELRAGPAPLDDPPSALAAELDSWLEGVLGPRSSCALPRPSRGRPRSAPTRVRRPTRPRAEPGRVGRSARAG